MKQHKVLDDRDIDKIEEDRYGLNTKKSTVWASFKRLFRGLKFQRMIHQLCSKECSVQRLCHQFGELYFSAEKHYEW